VEREINAAAVDARVLGEGVVAEQKPAGEHDDRKYGSTMRRGFSGGLDNGCVAVGQDRPQVERFAAGVFLTAQARSRMVCISPV
jgi:hypothetical protein